MTDGNYLLTCGDQCHQVHMQVLDKYLFPPRADMGELVREEPNPVRTLGNFAMEWAESQGETALNIAIWGLHSNRELHLTGTHGMRSNWHRLV